MEEYVVKIPDHIGWKERKDDVIAVNIQTGYVFEITEKLFFLNSLTYHECVKRNLEEVVEVMYIEGIIEIQYTNGVTCD